MKKIIGLFLILMVIAVQAETAYTVTLISNPPNAGKLSGSSTWLAGSDVYIHAVPNLKWGFVNWTEKGLYVSNNPDYSFTAINTDRTFTAVFISLPIVPIIPGLINFESQQWNSNQIVDSIFTIQDLTFILGKKSATNHGYNKDINGVSLYYDITNLKKDSIVIKSWGSQPIDLYSLSAYEVAQKGTDTLIIEGWNKISLKYTSKFININSWQILTLNYFNIDKIKIRSGNTVGTWYDYNFDNLLFHYRADINGDGIIDLNDMIIND